MKTDAEIEEFMNSERAKEPAPMSFVMRMIMTVIKANRAAEEKRKLRFAELESRLQELEQAPFEYAGVHEQGKAYRRGQFVTFQGSVWACKAATSQRPGDGDAWQLAVKKGKDGKDWDAR